LRVEDTNETELKYCFARSARIALREDEAIAGCFQWRGVFNPPCDFHRSLWYFYGKIPGFFKKSSYRLG